MQKFSAVIGSLLGDEGKGHITSELCKMPNTLNIRFNGGSQAAHTVVTPDGCRHAFHHFGSGTFEGAVTYLTEDFIVFPVTYEMERDELIKNFRIDPKVIVHPDAMVTTLWDMYLNQAIEEMRGNKRHGSCGIGIYETTERSKIARYQLTVKDLFNKDALREKAKAIQNEYVEMRLKNEYDVSVSDLPDEFSKLLSSEETFTMYMWFVDEFVNHITVGGYETVSCFDNVVFEGAQGLLLDQDNPLCSPDFLTASNTGMKNVSKVMRKVGASIPIDVYYVSRCYATRHGNGPMSNETYSIPYANVVDETNVANPFQGSLRFGYLDFDVLSQAIRGDIANVSVPANINIAFTCMDQIDAVARYYAAGNMHDKASSAFLKDASAILRRDIPLISGIYATSGLDAGLEKYV